MQECRIFFLVLLLFHGSSPQTIPSGWKAIKDSKKTCQIAVPPEWSLLTEDSGAAIFQDPTTAIAVVTSQRGQKFMPLTESMQKVLDIRKERMFENSAARTFYQDKVSKNSSDSNAYSVSVPSTTGTCSCHITFLPSVAEETAKKIAMSLAAAPEADRRVTPTGLD